SDNENDQIFIINYMFERAEKDFKQKKSIDYIDMWNQINYNSQLLKLDAKKEFDSLYNKLKLSIQSMTE
ncbi:23883_t:CDS:1, partial [Cetraspora pellucida]